MSESGHYPEASQATSSLIWSLGGLVCCPPAAVIGWIQARGEIKGIEQEVRAPKGYGSARAALVIATLALIFWSVAIVALSVLVLSGAVSEWIQGF